VASEFLLRFLFIAYAPLQRLIDGYSGHGRIIEFGASGNVEPRHLVGYRNDQL